MFLSNPCRALGILIFGSIAELANKVFHRPLGKPHGFIGNLKPYNLAGRQYNFG